MKVGKNDRVWQNFLSVEYGKTKNQNLREEDIRASLVFFHILLRFRDFSTVETLLLFSKMSVGNSSCFAKVCFHAL